MWVREGLFSQFLQAEATSAREKMMVWLSVVRGDRITCWS